MIVTRPQASSTRIPTLDGWRGVAILLVLLEHAGQYGRFKDQMWTNLGAFGVDIFFVLSGYIITKRLIDEYAESSTINLRSFYLRRAFRILPLVAIYLVALCVASWLVDLGDFRPSELVGALFFFRNYQYAAHPQGIYTAHFWSLSIEEHFYLLWPALLLWLRNRRSLWFAICMALTSAVWRAFERGHQGLRHVLPVGSPELHALQTDDRLDGLLLGSALALLLTQASIRAFIARNFQRETPFLLLPALFLNLLLAHGNPSFTLYLLIAVTLAYSLIVKHGPMFWWLNLRPVVWLGEISYSLYIWQQIFLIHPASLFPLGPLSIFPFNLACALVAAACSFYFIERPAIELGRRLYARKVYDPPPPAEGAEMVTENA